MIRTRVQVKLVTGGVFVSPSGTLVSSVSVKSTIQAKRAKTVAFKPDAELLIIPTVVLRIWMENSRFVSKAEDAHIQQHSSPV